MARWADRSDLFPAPLAEFAESEWPPVAGECLGRFSCFSGLDCAPQPGAVCGEFFYAECPPWRVAAERRNDALYRWRSARMSWLGEDHPLYVDEWLAGMADG